MIKNCYATPLDFQDWIRTETATSTVDDRVIDALLSAASRHIDRKTSRRFYPRIEAQLYDIPDDDDLMLFDDLLSLTTLTNGNGTVISASDYILATPRNGAPYYMVSLRDTASVGWELTSASSAQQAVSVLGVWGYRHHYATDGWEAVTTISAAITDTTSAGVTMTSTGGVSAGDIVKVDNEIVHILTVSSGTAATISRGDNGSTAATHLNGATVYRWAVEPDINIACLQIAHAAYQRRFGENVSSVATVTGAGVVITPQDVPAGARALYEPYKRVIG